MSDEKNSSAHSIDEKTEAQLAANVVTPSESEFDLVSYHEHNAGRLVVDPE